MYLRLCKVARDARTGRFISFLTARRRPSTTVVETYNILTYKRRAARRVRRRPNRPW